MAKGLTDQQRKFALRYVANGQNATEAATFAGYSPADAAARGSKLLQRPRVKELVAEHVLKALAKGQIETAVAAEVAAKAAAESAVAKSEAAKAVAKVQEKLELTAQRVLGETMKLAFSDARNIFAADGTLLNPKDWPDVAAGSVAAVEVVEEFDGQGKDRLQIGFTKKVKLWDKPKALEMLGKHLKLWTDVVEAKVDGLDDSARAERAASLIADALMRKGAA